MSLRVASGGGGDGAVPSSSEPTRRSEQQQTVTSSSMTSNGATTTSAQMSLSSSTTVHGGTTTTVSTGTSLDVAVELTDNDDDGEDSDDGDGGNDDDDDDDDDDDAAGSSVNGEQDSDEQSWRRQGKVSKSLLAKRRLRQQVTRLRMQLEDKELLSQKLRVEYSTKIDALETKVAELIHEQQLKLVKMQSEFSVRAAETSERVRETQAASDRIRVSNEALRLECETLREQLRSTTQRLDEARLQRQVELMATDRRQHHARAESPRATEARGDWKLEMEQLRDQLDRVRNRQAEADAKQQHLKLSQIELDKDMRQLPQLQQTDHSLHIGFASATDTTQEGAKPTNEGTVKRINREGTSDNRGDSGQRGGSGGGGGGGGGSGGSGGGSGGGGPTEDQLRDAERDLKLLGQDKEYLSKQKLELSNRVVVLEERLEAMTKQRDDALRSKEQLFERYMNGLEAAKSDYTRRLEAETAALRSQNAEELDRIKRSSRELHDGELLSLRHSKMELVHENAELQSQLRDACASNDQLKETLASVRISYESRLLDLQAELKANSYELQRAEAQHQTDMSSNRQKCLEIEQLSRKLQILGDEYRSHQQEASAQLSAVENQLLDASNRLQSYEAAEHQLDQVLLEAASLAERPSGPPGDKQAAGTEAEAEALLAGYGGTVATDSARRLQHSMRLARRVVQLDKQNALLSADLRTARSAVESLEQRLTVAEAGLGQVKQPLPLVMDSLRSKDQLIEEQRQLIGRLQDQLAKLESELKWERESKAQMMSDVAVLRDQNRALDVLKKSVGDLQRLLQRCLKDQDLSKLGQLLASSSKTLQL